MKENKVDESVFFVCPSGCHDALFFQDGTREVTCFFNENGEECDEDRYDFVPKTKMMCRKCGEVAIKKKKIIKTETIIE